MLPFLKLHAICPEDPAQASYRIAEAIGASGGWVEDGNMLGNKAEVLRFAIDAEDLVGLLDALRACNLRFSPPTQRALDEVLAALPPVGTELDGTLEVTFSCDGLDGRVVVPAVPH